MPQLPRYRMFRQGSAARGTRPSQKLIVLVLALLGIAMARPSPISELAGRYSRSFDGELANGAIYKGEQVVEVVPVDRTHAYVRAELDFANAHHCGIFGVASVVGEKLVYLERVGQPGEEPCRLSVSRAGTSLLLDDGGATCQAYCGAGGSLSNFQYLPFSLKRPIRNLAKLKQTDEYRAAIEEWESGG